MESLPDREEILDFVKNHDIKKFLTQNQEKCFTLRFFENKTFGEIGEEIKLTSVMCNVHYKNSLKRIKMEMACEETGLTIDMSIEKSNLSNRTKWSLINYDIKTFKQANSFTDKELLKIRNFGKTSLKELRQYIQIITGEIEPEEEYKSEEFEQNLNKILTKKLNACENYIKEIKFLINSLDTHKQQSQNLEQSHLKDS